MYEVYHKRTGKIIGKRKTRSAAWKLADKKDNEYGSYIHGVRLCNI